MNPLLLRLIPLAVSAAAGFAIAWGIQGLRLTSAEHEFVEYKQEQVRLAQKRKDDADKQRNEAAARYADSSAELRKQIDEGEVIKRCIASGRCSVARNPSGLCESTSRRAGAGLSAPRRVDDPGQDTIFAAGKLAEECAVTTLQLNQLQQDIENQPGYRN